MSDPKPNPPPHPSPDDDEVLDAGQEEVFSKTEVELGRIEHAHDAGKGDKPA
jgi:hypothetical protein